MPFVFALGLAFKTRLGDIFKARTEAGFWLLLALLVMVQFWFGSTSLRYYNPITLLPRMCMQVMPPLCLAAAFGVHYFLNGNRKLAGFFALLFAAAAFFERGNMLAIYVPLAAWWLRRLHVPVRIPAASDAGTAAVPRGGSSGPFTAPRAVTSVVQLALQRLDIVLLTLLAGPRRGGRLHRGHPVPRRRSDRSTRRWPSVVEPRLGRLFALDDRPPPSAVYRTATGWLVLLCWPLYLLAATYADGFLDWFGSGYDTRASRSSSSSATMLVATVGRHGRRRPDHGRPHPLEPRQLGHRAGRQRRRRPAADPAPRAARRGHRHGPRRSW